MAAVVGADDGSSSRGSTQRFIPPSPLPDSETAAGLERGMKPG